MAFDFPNSPTLGQIATGPGIQWQWDGAKWVVMGGSTRAYNNVTISSIPPTSPAAGDMWWNTNDGNLYIFFNDGTSSQWVVANASNPSMPEAPTDGRTYLRQGSTQSWTVNRVGITDGSNAPPGMVGEYINVANTPPYVTFSGSSSYQNILSFTLQPGDWDLQGTWTYLSDGTVWNMISSISTTSLTLGSQDAEFAFGGPGSTSTGHWSGNTSITPLNRWNVTIPTTLYLVAYVGGWASGQNGTYIRGTGYVVGRRVR